MFILFPLKQVFNKFMRLASNKKVTRIYNSDHTIFSQKLAPEKWDTLRKYCPYSEPFWSVFSHIRTEYGQILRISP